VIERDSEDNVMSGKWLLAIFGDVRLDTLTHQHCKNIEM
jgi:hypothetical protein